MSNAAFQILLLQPILDGLKSSLRGLNDLGGSGAGGGGIFGGIAGGIASIFGFKDGGLVPAFANGGMVKPLHFAGGGIPAIVHPGEFVIRQPAVDAFGAENLAAINQNGACLGAVCSRS